MKDEFRRNLPHFYAQDAIYDISFRLVNTVPKNIFDEYIYKRKCLIKKGKRKNIDQLYKDYIESFLDNSGNEKDWLFNESICNEVISAIQFYNEKRYSVIAYCIMPNHVHLILNTMNFPYHPLGDLLKSIKQFSGKQANKIINRKGQFWHSESYDHIIKSRNELAIRIDYLINNPVKAKLVSKWQDWKGTFVDRRFQDV